MSDPVSDVLKQLEEDILAHGDSAAVQKPVAKKQKSASASPKPRAAAAYDVFNTMKNAESAVPDKRASSLDQLLCSIVDANKASDVVSVQLAFVKPYGELVLARVMPPPGAPVIKKLAKLSGKAALSAEKTKPSKDFIVLRKKKAEKITKIKKEKKSEKKAASKKSAASTDPAHARIKANLDKLKKKQPATQMSV